MVKLFCVIVGDTGNVFSVRVREADSVDALKKAIAEDQKYNFAAGMLRIFLAKRTTNKGEKGEWLTQLDALEGVSDYKDLPVPGAQLRASGLASGQLGEVSDEEGAAGKGPVHVLVVVPPKQDNLRSSEMALLEVMLAHVLTHAPTTPTERNGDFKHQLCNFYGCYRRKKSWVRCMLLDAAFPKSLVVASHLFRCSNEHLSLLMMQISDIDDEEWFVAVQALELALHDFQSSFIRDDTDAFRLQLFDPSTRDTRLIDLTDRDGNRVLNTEQT